VTRTAILVEQNWNAVPGGTARSTNTLVESLLSYTDVEMIGVSGLHRRAPVLDLPTGLDRQQIPVPGRVLTEAWSRFGWPSIDRWLEADVTHAPAYVVPPVTTPLVVTIHDLAFVRHPEWFTANGVRFFNRFLRSAVVSDAAVVVPSETTADDCVVAGIDEQRITTIPWGVNQTQASAAEIGEVRKRHGLREEFVLYVGTLEPRKNLASLAAAMAAVESAPPLVVVGPCGWGDVTVPGGMLLGEVSDSDVAALMAAALMLVYPSHFEGFGLPVLEAMAQGTPVVVTNNTAPAEIAKDAGLAVDTTSPSALAAAIETLLRDEGERTAMGEHGRLRAASYQWSKTAEATAALYEAVTR
jgi:glycosyltransferase involved in cell wall biosynthesis